VTGNADSEVTCWNTKFLNLFSQHSIYCDKIKDIEFLIYKTNIQEFLNNYQDLDLGAKFINIEFTGMDHENYTKPDLWKTSRKELPLSALLTIIKRFSEDASIRIGWATITNDLNNYPAFDSHCERLQISSCNLETKIIRLLIDNAQIPPRNFEIDRNDLQGSENELIELGLNHNQFNEYNEFSEHKPTPQ
jgi:hypothetical protein